MFFIHSSAHSCAHIDVLTLSLTFCGREKKSSHWFCRRHSCTHVNSPTVAGGAKACGRDKLSSAKCCDLHSCPHSQASGGFCGADKPAARNFCSLHSCPHLSKHHGSHSDEACGRDKRRSRERCAGHSCLFLTETGLPCYADKKGRATYCSKHTASVDNLIGLPPQPGGQQEVGKEERKTVEN